MAVIKVQAQKDFTVLFNVVLENPNLSFKAKGLWAYCMSRPNNWEFHVNHLATVSKDGTDGVYSALKELIAEGLVEKIQKNERGKFGKVDYLIFPYPPEFKKCLPHRDFPQTEKPQTENPALLNTDTYKERKKEREGGSPPIPLPPTFVFKSVKMKQEEYNHLIADFGELKIKEMLERLDEYSDINPKKFKGYGNHSRVIRKWIREDGNKPQGKGASNNQVSENKLFAFKVKAKHGNHSDIRFGEEYIEFNRGPNVPSVHIKFSDHGFKDQVLGNLEKMKLDTRSLKTT